MTPWPKSLQFIPNVTFCVIWAHLPNFKNVKNAHECLSLLVKLQVSACNFTKDNAPPWVFLFFCFLNCANGRKSHKAPQVLFFVIFRVTIRHNSKIEINLNHKIIFFSLHILIRPISTNPIKWSNTLKQFVCNFPTNCLSVFDHFVKLVLKWLKHVNCWGDGVGRGRRRINALCNIVLLLKLMRHGVLYYLWSAYLLKSFSQLIL